MSLATPADLEAHTGETDDGQFQVYIDQSEAAIAGEIRVESLSEQTGFKFQMEVEQGTRHLYPEEGPVTAITDVVGIGSTTLASIPGASFTLLSIWDLFLSDRDQPAFIFGQCLELDVTLGWTSGNVPSDLKLGILEAAEWYGSVQPNSGIASERLGDYAYTLRQAPGSLEQYLPGAVMPKLFKYLRGVW